MVCIPLSRELPTDLTYLIETIYSGKNPSWSRPGDIKLGIGSSTYFILIFIFFFFNLLYSISVAINKNLVL